MQSQTLAIQTAGLSKHFGPHRAVDMLDLAIHQGSIFGFLGPNGAGKQPSCFAGVICSGSDKDVWRAGSILFHLACSMPSLSVSRVALCLSRTTLLAKKRGDGLPLLFVKKTPPGQEMEHPELSSCVSFYRRRATS